MHSAASFRGPLAHPAVRVDDASTMAPRRGDGPVASRRTFLAAAAMATSAVPVGGVFAGGGERLRIGLVGCGGRGTGAALQAAAADPAIRIVALGDLFADQVAATAELLSRRVGPQFACPPGQRFVGADAFRSVIGSDIDLVLLAAPPHLRPLHLEAAIAAGRHVYCEKPMAVDAAGAVRAAAAAARGSAAGLALVSGFCFRRDDATRELVARIHAGEIGRPLELHAHAAIGLPWRKPAVAGDAAGAWRQRNWISFAGLSGGHFVEHHVEAIDRAMWILGDVPPLSAEVVSRAAGDAPATAEIGDCAPSTSVRYHFADGTTLESSIDRRQRVRDRRLECVVGSKGLCDLSRGIIGGTAVPAQPGGPGRHQAAMTAFVRGVFAGSVAPDVETACRSTMVAVMGRMAAERGRRIHWQEIADSAVPSSRPV